MSLSEFRAHLLAAISMHFPSARVDVSERRNAILRVRAEIPNEILLDVYYNDLTGKTSYTLIHRQQRILGYDNYRFWHAHPYDSPAEHIACTEPELDQVLVEFSEVVARLESIAGEEVDDS